MERKKGINCGCVTELSPVEVLPMIREAGFDAVFTASVDPETVKSISKTASALGLALEFLHAPFRGINDVWLEGEAYRALWDQHYLAVDLAAEYGIPSVIVHVSSTYRPPEINDLGLSRFDALVDHAETKGVIIALENLRKVGNLSYLADRYEEREHVRFCYDSGHRHCYTPKMEWIDFFADRIVATHIHDNLGQTPGLQEHDDLHYLPFDGNVDYTDMMRRLDRVGYEGSLMLEVFQRAKREYADLSPREFITEAYRRIDRIAKL